jgi:hypothetical protein
VPSPYQPPPSTRSDAVAPGVGFGPALRELFVAAGSPMLTETAEAANAAGASGVTSQRLSNWRSGRHLPDSFDTIAPVLIWLTIRAREHATDPSQRSQDVPSVRSMRDWYRIFTAEQSPTAVADLKTRIDAAELLITHPEPDTLAAEAMDDQLTTAVLQLTGIDPTTGVPVATEAPFAALPADAADLLSATGLITTATSPREQAQSTQWVDPKIATLWGRAAPLVEKYRPALAARTALLADAARWSAAGDPQGLYTWQQLTTCGRHLHTLPAGIIASPEPAAQYRFGDGVTAGHIPTAALPFWEAAQNAAERQLTVHRLIMATVIAVIALAVIAGGIAGFLTS